MLVAEELMLSATAALSQHRDAVVCRAFSWDGEAARPLSTRLHEVATARCGAATVATPAISTADADGGSPVCARPQPGDRCSLLAGSPIVCGGLVSAKDFLYCSTASDAAPV